jgi:uncharacterized protein YcbX
MSIIGYVDSITRYPVKSMAGECLQDATLTPHGLEFDRLYAFESSAAPPGMLRLRGAERRRMLGYRAHAQADGVVEILTPDGQRLPAESPELLARLQEDADHGSLLSLTRAPTPQTDVRPISLVSTQTIEAISATFGARLDVRRFRANLVLNLGTGAFSEDELAGRAILIGPTAKLLVRERTPRCRFVTYDPEAPHANEPLVSLMKLLDREHKGRVGVYASVLTPGPISVHATVRLCDSQA